MERMRADRVIGTGSTDVTGLADGDLIARARAGCDHALAEILRRYRPLVRSRSSRYYLQGAERSDVTQEGMIGLYKAIRDYAPQRGTEFAPFAQRCITRQIISAVRGAQRAKHQPLNASISLEGGLDVRGTEAWEADAWASAGPAGDPAVDVVARAEAEAIGRWCSDHLSPMEVEVLRRHLAGDSYAQIGAANGLTPKAVDNAVQRIRRKLERHLARAEASLAA
jgi:RNA polymerase sporulation-specific sigma factor